VADTQTEESPTSPLNADDIVEKLAQADFLSGLLADPDVKAALLGEIRELGFRPPLHYVVLRLITALVAKSESFIGKAISSRLQAFIDHTPLLAGLLERLVTIQHGKETNDALKTSILGAITEGRPFDINAIEIDSTTPIETMLALHNVQGFERVLGELDGQTDTLIRTFREDISNLFQNMVAPALSWPPEVLSPKGAFDRVKYTSGLDQLYGRDTEITLLHEFAGDMSLCGRLFNFRWMLLTGDGGTGKTRLAYDFTRKHLTPNIWDAGRLSIDDLPGFNDLEKWRPRQPTFIVIDYVSGHPEKTGKLLRILARKAAHYDFPVRILLLERKADQSWLGKMLPEDGDKPMVMDHVFGHEDENGLIIPPVDATAIKKMMKERFAKAGQTPPDDALLLAAAQRVDTRPHDANLPRPLFALATAEAMMAEAEKEPEAQPDFAKIAALLNQEDVLAGMLRREEHTRWQPAAPNDGGGTLTRYKLALALATLTKGLDLNDLDTKEEDYGSVARYLPDPPPDHHQGMISALGGSHTFLPPLEPDIMGEFFLAETLLNDIPNHRHRFLSATLEKGHIEPLITLLRLQQDFPQKIAAIDIPAAMLACQTETAAVSYALMAPNWVNQCYTSHNPEAADSFMTSIKQLVTRFDKNAEIALHEAMAAFNISYHAAEKGDGKRVDAMMARLDALRSQFNDNTEIALAEAKAAVNISSDVGKKDDGKRVDAMMARLDALRSQFNDNTEIALAEAKAAFNISNHAAKKADGKQVDAMMARLDVLRSQFNDDPKIALHEAMVAVNISSNAGKKGDGERVDAMMARLDALRSQFNDDPEIALHEAMAAVNICNHAAKKGDWKRVDAMMARLEALRSQFNDNPEIALREAMAAFNISNHAAKKGDWERLGAIIARLDVLRSQFNGDPEIALHEAMAAVNISNHAGEKGDWKRVDAMIARLDALRSQFNDNTEIALREAMVAFNISNHAGEKGDWKRVDAMIARLDALRSQFNDNTEITLAEAKAAFNISNHAGEKGDGKRIDAMLQRLITIDDTFGGKLVLGEAAGQSVTLADAINYVTEILNNKP
jgi:archaellum component FlaC